MSRKLFLATTVAVVCCVGDAQASQTTPDGSGRSVSSQIPECVTAILTPASDRPSPFAVLSHPMDMPIPVRAALNQPRRIDHPVIIEEQHPTSAELPLVPLPAPVLTGGAGLLGLGFVGLCKKIRKGLRYPDTYRN